MANESPATYSPKSKTTLIIIAVVIVVLGLGIYFYFSKKSATLEQPPAAAPIATPSLGGDLYQKASNPIQGQLPETVAPVPNPLKNVYKNPFQ